MVSGPSIGQHSPGSLKSYGFMFLSVLFPRSVLPVLTPYSVTPSLRVLVVPRFLHLTQPAGIHAPP